MEKNMRLLEITKCTRCVFSFVIPPSVPGEASGYCMKNNHREIADYNVIPDWCELPIANDYNNEPNGV